MKKKMKDDNIIKKSFISSILFIIIVMIVFYFIFKDNNYKEVQHMFVTADRRFLILAILCMSCFSICEALNVKTVLNTLGDKISFKDAYKYSLSGFFVSSITPSSTGGDPMELYMMSRDKIKISHGAISLLLKLLSYQFVLFLLAIFGFLTSYKIFMSSLGNLKYLAFLGIFLNLLVFTLYFLIIFFKPAILFLVDLFSKLLHKIHFKKADSLIENLLKQVDEYSKAATYLKKNKKIFVKLFLTTLAQMILYYCIPYFVYLSLGLRGTSIITFISVQSMLFISVSSIPSPGAVGISEATFMKIYSQIYPETVLGSAMIITRFINFYIFVLFAGIMMMGYFVRDNFKTKE